MKKRLNSRPAVQLPLNALLSQFSDPQSPPQVTVSSRVNNVDRIHVHEFLDQRLEIENRS